MTEDLWLIEKTCTILEALAEIAEYRNRLPNHGEEPIGQPTREAMLNSALHTAVHTATRVLANKINVEWQTIDRECILHHGETGLQELISRYGIELPQHRFPPLVDENSQPESLSMLNALKATWTFANFDVIRPLRGMVTWEGIVADEDRQRALLVQAFEEALRYAMQPQGWLFISGPIGAGKSHLAGAIIRHALQQGARALYLSALSLSYRYRSPNDPEWIAEQPYLEAIELLVLDDLFLDERLIWNQCIEQLLRSRHVDARPTVLVSTRSREHLPLWLSSTLTEISVITSSYRRLGKHA
jgi:DNA replication protein DnaC